MPAANFPDAPTMNQIYQVPNGPSYTWDGTKWGVFPSGWTDAPQTGVNFERNNLTWVADPIQSDAPDSSNYVRQKGLWAAMPPSPINTDAPDASFYVRQKGAWALEAIQADAPDTNNYARQKGGWSQLPSGLFVPIGGIVLFAAVAVPANFLLCDGTVYNISAYPTLAGVIGNAYGGDGTATFAVPNIVNNFPRGGTPGAVGGAATVSLAAANMPSHTHTVPAHAHGLNDPGHTHSLSTTVLTASSGGNAPGGAGWAFTTVGMSTVGTGCSVAANGPWTSGAAGSGSAFNILPPYQAFSFIIRYL